MKKNAFSYWKEHAENDFKVAAILFTEGERKGFAYQACVFHCHQAVEKMMKAIVVSHNSMPPRIHDLVALSMKLDIAIPEDIAAALDALNPHYLRPRYPDVPFSRAFQFTYNRRNTQKIIEQTTDILVWLRHQFKRS